jgi:hypothetical protein
MKHVTHQQVVAGHTTAGPLAVLLSRFVLWMKGETVEKLHNELIGANAELTYLRGLLAERYVGEWKVTKDGTKRYRKVATKVLVNAWVTESEPIETCKSMAESKCECGGSGCWVCNW